MACQAVYTWSLSGLVGAFVDLSIAYFLLCASAVCFLASKFLGVFSLSLPCLCDGALGVRFNRNLCVHKLFIEYPLEKVANVQLSVVSRFPFYQSVWIRNQNSDLNLGLTGGNERKVIELGGGASSSEVSIVRKSSKGAGFSGEMNATDEVGTEVVKLLGMKEGRFGMKGKGIIHQRHPRSSTRRRRKGGSDHEKYSAVASYNPAFGDLQNLPESPPSIKRGTDRFTVDGIDKFGDEIVTASVCAEESLMEMKEGQVISSSIELTDMSEYGDHSEKDVASVCGLKDKDQIGLVYNGDDKNTIRILEQALEEQQNAYAAIYLELEQERSAAASAADEAIAMIMRLQEEKASIEMEARQYQRIIEEKSAYDAEEMNILKEIIIRREREKHFLEKEVEAYEQMINVSNEDPADNAEDVLGADEKLLDLLDSSEDQLVMPQQSASVDDKGMIGSRNSAKDISVINQTAPAWAEQDMQGKDENAGLQKQEEHSRCHICDNDGYRKLQDKMITMDKNSFTPPSIIKGDCTFIEPYNPGSPDGTFPREDTNTMGRGKEFGEGKEPHGVVDQALNEEPYIHDIHVVAGQSDNLNQVSTSKGILTPSISTSAVPAGYDDSSEASVLHQFNILSERENSTRVFGSEVDIKSSSDVTGRLPPRGPKGKNPKRDSMYVVENERLKIDHEIERLRERLKTVQEGREKFNVSVEHREMGRRQLSLLEDIANQLQEIRLLTEREKAVRQASLPLPTTKVTSKKRRCRSVSLGQQSS